jgi:hypothetical protein
MVDSTKNPGGAPVGNQNAAKGAQLTAMLMHALEDNDRQKLREGIAKLATAFSEGERWAIEFVFDRKEGKAAQALTLKGDEENPLHVTHGLSDALIGMLNEISAE